MTVLWKMARLSPCRSSTTADRSLETMRRWHRRALARNSHTL